MIQMYDNGIDIRQLNIYNEEKPLIHSEKVIKQIIRKERGNQE